MSDFFKCRGVTKSKTTKASTKISKPQFTLKFFLNVPQASINNGKTQKKNKIVSNVKQRITNFQMPQLRLRKKRSK